MANEPFLAKVELFFPGTSSEETFPDQKVIFEHWVDVSATLLFLDTEMQFQLFSWTLLEIGV